jgi:hypothetical protein
MGGPDFTGWRIECDGFCVGDVVTQLCFLTVLNNPRGNIERAYGQFGAAKLFESATILFALLRGFLCGLAACILAIGFQTGEQNKGNVKSDAGQHDGRIKEGVLPEWFLRRWWFDIHWASLSEADRESMSLSASCTELSMLFMRAVTSVRIGEQCP